MPCAHVPVPLPHSGSPTGRCGSARSVRRVRIGRPGALTRQHRPAALLAQPWRRRFDHGQTSILTDSPFPSLLRTPRQGHPRQLGAVYPVALAVSFSQALSPSPRAAPMISCRSRSPRMAPSTDWTGPPAGGSAPGLWSPGASATVQTSRAAPETAEPSGSIGHNRSPWIPLTACLERMHLRSPAAGQPCLPLPRSFAR